jgi:quercetin dioxygenase-like cupin family protein
MVLVRGEEAEAHNRELAVTRLLAGPRLGSEQLVVTRHTLWADELDAPHSHDREKVVFVLSGRLRAQVNGETAELVEGDALLIRAGDVHDVCSASTTTPCEFVVFTTGIMRFFEPDGTEVELPSIAAAETHSA